MSAYAAIQLVDLAEIYMQIGTMPGRLHAPKRTAQQVTIPGRAGATITDLVSAGAREINFNGAVFAETLLLTDREAAEDALKELSYHSRVNVRVSDGTNAPRMIEGYATNISIDPKGLTSLSIASDLAIAVLAEPFWRDINPRQIAVVESLKELVMGTAPSPPIARLMGAVTPVVDPIITFYRMSGEAVASLAFDISLSDDDWVEHNFNTGLTRKSIDGTITFDSSIVDGDLFFALQPKHGNRQLGAWPTAALTATSGTPTGELQYTRMWL